MSTPPSLHRADSNRSTSSSRPSASVGDAKHQEELIQSLEAEEERLVNTLTRKLEKLRAEKVELENVLEAESESLVLRLQRQLQDLMRQQQQQSQVAPASQPQPTSQSLPTSISQTPATEPGPSPNLTSLLPGQNPLQPTPETLIQALKSENSTLRNRLVDTEREYIKTSRQSDSYRSELIALRQRAGIPIDDLVGTGAAFEEGPPPASVARRWSRTHSTAASGGIPIPGSLQRRPVATSGSPSSPSMSLGQVSSLSLPSSTPLSPTTDSSPNSLSPRDTTLTTPSTSYPGLPVPFSTPVASPPGPRAGFLGTPSSIPVPPPPPPSAASSLRHPTSYQSHLPPYGTDLSSSTQSSAATPLSQSPSSRDGSLSRRTSNARVAETGVLMPRRSRVGSVGAPGAPEGRKMPSS